MSEVIIKQLVDNEGNPIAGLTPEAAVYDQNGARLNETITALEQEQIQGGVYDVSSHNDGAVFESLSTLLSSANLSTLIPTSVRRGGMSIRFIQSSDNKYVQYRYMGTDITGNPNPFLDTANWQGADEVPTPGSENLVKSGGVYRRIDGNLTINKYIDSAGNEQIDTTKQRFCTGFIPVSPWVLYNFKPVVPSNSYIAFYDSSKNFIPASAQQGYNLQKSITSPGQSAFVRATFRKSDIETATIENNGTVIYASFSGLQNEINEIKEEVTSHTNSIENLDKKVSYDDIRIDYLSFSTGENGGINTNSFGNNGSNNYRHTGFIGVKKGDIVVAEGYCATTVYMIAFTTDKTTVAAKVTGNGESVLVSKTLAVENDGYVVFSWKTTQALKVTVNGQKDQDVDAKFTQIENKFFKGVHLWYANDSYPNIDTNAKTIDLQVNPILYVNNQSYILGTIWSGDTSKFRAIPLHATAQYQAIVFNIDTKIIRCQGYTDTVTDKEVVIGTFRVLYSGSTLKVTHVDCPFKCQVDGAFIEDNILEDNVLACYPQKEWRPKICAISSVIKDFANNSQEIRAHRIVDLGLTLLWFTDLHNSISNHTNLDRIVTFNKFYGGNKLDYGGIDDVISTGDFQRDQFTDDFSFWEDSGASSFLNVIGNHDAWYNGQNIKDKKSIYDKYFAPYISSWGVTRPTNAATDGKCYYYKDYTKSHTSDNYTINQKVRLIVLDCMNWDADQYTWLVSTLEDSRTNGFSVICAVHYEAGTIIFDKSCVFETIKSQDSHQTSLESVASSTETGNPLDAVDDFIENGGEFICWLGGHTHMNRFGVLQNHPNQLNIIGGSANGAKLGAAEIGGYPSSPNSIKLEYTNVEDEFNIISFDCYNKYIKILRVGRNLDVYMRKAETICYDYANHRIVYQNGTPVTLE